jgi:cytoskeleton protein RodZ
VFFVDFVAALSFIEYCRTHDVEIDSYVGSEYNAHALARSEKKNRFLKIDAADARHVPESTFASSAPPPTKTSLGDDIRARRIEKDITLKKVSEDTHISLRHLQSLEEGNYRDLPGGMYNRAFVRSYCIYLGLDPVPYLERYEAASAPVHEKVAKARVRIQQVHTPPIRIPPVLIWTIMLLVSVTGIYLSHGWIARVFSPYFSRPPATRIPAQPPAPAPQAAKGNEPVQGVAAPTTTAEPSVLPIQSPTQPPATAGAPGTTLTPATTPQDVPPPQGTMRLHFEVTQDCWMSLTGDGATAYVGILKPGETPQFDAKSYFTMVLGNAGGIRLKINGKPAKPLGAPGAVIKIVINADTIPELIEKIAS